MSTIVTAWLLLANPNINSAYAVPGIATEQECERLLRETKWAFGGSRCIPYQMIVSKP